MPIYEGLPPVSDDSFILLAQLYSYDEQSDTNTSVISRKENSSQILEKMVIRGLHNLKVPGLLSLPATGSPPYPCVLMLHGLSGRKEDWFELEPENNGITNKLSSAGYAILALDGPLHGERTAEIDYLPILSYLQPNTYREMVIDWVVEHRIALDYLECRSEIDSKRIGALGYSLGGVVVFILAGVEQRIKTALTCSTLPISQYYLNQIGWDEGSLVALAPIAPQIFAQRITNTPFLMLNGKMDRWGTVDEIYELFDAIRSPIKKIATFDCGHRLPEEYLTLVPDWFQNVL